MKELIGVAPKLHVFVCINDRSSNPTATLPSCGPTISEQTIREVKQWIFASGLGSKVYCTKTRCLGFCSPDGGVVALYPQGTFYSGILNAGQIIDLIKGQL